MNQKKIVWEGVISLGSKIEENADAWNAGKICYMNGYTALKRVLWFDHDYEVLCKIIQSTTGRPLFQCILKENDVILDSVTATNPTTAAKKILIGRDIKLNFKNGNSFFGLDRKDIQDRISKCSKNNNTDDSNVELGALTAASQQRQASWFGVVSFGEINEPKNFISTFGGKSFRLQPGYECLRKVILVNNEEVILHCKVDLNSSGSIIYKCFTVKEPIVSFEDKQPTPSVKQALSSLGVITKKKWSGFDFFGFMRPDVLKVLASKSTHRESTAKLKKNDLNHSVLKTGMQVRCRNAGNTSSLKNKKSVKYRNECVHNLVDYISFGDVKSYVKHLCENYPEVIEESIESTPSFERQFIKKLKVSTKAIHLDSFGTAELLLGKCSLSQRGYKNLREILGKNNIKLPTYEQVRRYCIEANVGHIEYIHGVDDDCPCMGVKSNVKDTLQRIVSCEKLFAQFVFFDENSQNIFFPILKTKSPTLYKNLDEQKRTIFIRATGDNFRAASRYPTEQTSISLLNIPSLINSPYGQFITTLWRGSESREMLDSHVKSFFEELTNCVEQGIELIVGNKLEQFNIICIFVADLCFIKDIVGMCTCTSTYGCYHCLLPRNDWSSQVKQIGKNRILQDTIDNGIAAFNELGVQPDRNSSKFKEVQLKYKGSWTTVTFSGFITELMPPCGLHLILAHHRYLYKFMYDIVNKRNMDSRIPEALRRIGCGYLAFQVDTYFKSKKKNYDGSETLKMIGNDCKLLEENIDTFLFTFVNKEKGEKWEDASCLKLRQVLDLYVKFRDLASDIRSSNAISARVASFENRAEIFFKKFSVAAGSTVMKGLPYLHYLRNHLGKLMMFYSEMIGWGYGFFSCNAGEHLNKRIKFSELNETNLDKKRFHTIMHIMRLRQFNFTDGILSRPKEIKCSMCGEIGHNKKNKSCPLHPSHPPIVFDNSDEEDL